MTWIFAQKLLAAGMGGLIVGWTAAMLVQLFSKDFKLLNDYEEDEDYAQG